MEEKLSLIKIPIIRKRIKREIEDLIAFNVCNLDDVSILNISDGHYEAKVLLQLNSNIYEFYIHNNYPFTPPKFYINNIKYLSRHMVLSEKFRNDLRKYTGLNCFCCESILCWANWSPNLSIKHILKEYEKYKNACREVVHRIILDVIKRKYLNNYINIVEWLY